MGKRAIGSPWAPAKGQPGGRRSRRGSAVLRAYAHLLPAAIWLLVAAAAQGKAGPLPPGLSALWAEVPADCQQAVAVAAPKVAAEAWQAFVKAHGLGTLAEEASAPRLAIREAFGIDPLAADDLLRAGLEGTSGVLLFWPAGHARLAKAPARPSNAILVAHVASPNALAAFLPAWAAADGSAAPQHCRAHAGTALCQVPGQDSYATAGNLVWLAPKGAAQGLPAALAARAAEQTLLRGAALRRPLRPLAQSSATLTAFVAHGGFGRCQSSNILGSLWTARLGAEGIDAKGQLLGAVDANCLTEPGAARFPAAVHAAPLAVAWGVLSTTSLPQAWQLAEHVAHRLGPGGWLGAPKPADWLRLPRPWPSQLSGNGSAPPLGAGDLNMAGLLANWRFLLRGHVPSGSGPPKVWQERGPPPRCGASAGQWQLAANDSQVALEAQGALAKQAGPTSAPHLGAGRPAGAKAEGGSAGPNGRVQELSPPLLRASVDLVALAAAFESGLQAKASAWPAGGLMGQFLPMAQLLPTGPIGDRLEDASNLGRLEATVWREQDQLIWHLQQRRQRLPTP